MRSAQAFAAAGLLTLALTTAHGGDWPAFRGDTTGVASETNLPAKIDDAHLVWKTKLPGPGASSPIVVGNKLFLTSYTGYGTTITKGFSGGKGKGGGGKDGGTATGDASKLKFVLQCIDPKTGKTEWEKDVEPKLPEAPFTGFLREHGYASSTPASDGARVYVFFGKTGVFAYDLAGKQVWQADVGSGTDKWGSGSSPIVYKDKVIVNASIESGAVIALDSATGKEAWRIKDVSTCWVSPVVAKTADGKDELVLSLSGRVVGYDLDSGKELWRCKGIGSGGQGYTSSTPVVRDGVVYVTGGGGPNPQTALAVKVGGRGDVDASHVLWRQKQAPGISSPLVVGKQLCWVAGSVVALDLADGKVAHNERLYEGRGEYVSPVTADGKIYALTRLDGMFVLSGDGKYEKLSHYDFPGDTSIFNASPAIANGRIFVRSNANLYCFGNK
jgi:outer membrane protein assembly factor BamB